MAEFGTSEGFSVKLPDETYGIRMRGAMQRQAQALQEHKVAMLSDDMKYATPMNAWDKGKVSKEAEALANELGSLVNNNPDYGININTKRQYNDIKNRMTNLPSLAKGKLTDKAYTDWQTDMAKNPDKLSPDAWEDTKKEWEEYQKTGKYKGQNVPFMYVAPAPYDLNKNIAGWADELNKAKRTTGIQGYGPNATQEFVAPQQASSRAAQIMTQPSDKFHVERDYALYKEKNPDYAKDATGWLSDQLLNLTGNKITSHPYPSTLTVAGERRIKEASQTSYSVDDKTGTENYQLSPPSNKVIAGEKLTGNVPYKDSRSSKGEGEVLLQSYHKTPDGKVYGQGLTFTKEAKAANSEAERLDNIDYRNWIKQRENDPEGTPAQPPRNRVKQPPTLKVSLDEKAVAQLAHNEFNTNIYDVLSSKKGTKGFSQNIGGTNLQTNAEKNRDQTQIDNKSKNAEKSAQNKPKTVIQNGHTYTLNDATGEYE